VHLERVSETVFATPIDLLKSENIPTLRFLEGDVVPPRGEERYRPPKGESVPAPTVHQWTRAEGGCQKVVWRMWGESATEMGDTTVPLDSLLGIGGEARFAPAIQAGKHTEHAKTPNEGGIWLHIVGSLQGTWVPPLSTGAQVLEALKPSST
jgi:hypothetical protein